jgi:hypothetical protein
MGLGGVYSRLDRLEQLERGGVAMMTQRKALALWAVSFLALCALIFGAERVWRAKHPVAVLENAPVPAHKFGGSASSDLSAKTINGARMGPAPHVRAVCPVAVTRSGAQTCDGVALNNNDRVLTAGTSDVNARIWSVNTAGAWTAATDFATSADAVPGSSVQVTEGTQRGRWTLVTTGTIVLGSTPLEWHPASTITDVRLFDNGVTGGITVVAAAAAAAGANGTLFLPASKVYSIGGSPTLTIGRLVVDDQVGRAGNGGFDVTGGQVLTIVAGEVVAPENVQIFAGSGSTYLSIDRGSVHSAWWGVVQTTDATPTTILTVLLPSDVWKVLDVSLIGRRAGGASDAGVVGDSLIVSGQMTAKPDIFGTATAANGAALGTDAFLSVNYKSAAFAAAGVTWAVSSSTGGRVTLTGTGAAGLSINWSGSIRIVQQMW